MGIDTLVEVEPSRRAAAAIDTVVVAERQWSRQNRRPPALTAREALVALEFEAVFTWTCAQNMATGMVLSDEDRARLTLAGNRIGTLVGEINR